MATGNERYSDDFLTLGALPAPWGPAAVGVDSTLAGVPYVASYGGSNAVGAASHPTGGMSVWEALYGSPIADAQFVEGTLAAIPARLMLQITATRGFINYADNYSVRFFDNAPGSDTPDYVVDGDPLGPLHIPFDPRDHRWRLEWDGHFAAIYCDGSLIVGTGTSDSANPLAPYYQMKGGYPGLAVDYEGTDSGFKGAWRHFACGSLAKYLTIDTVTDNGGGSYTVSGKRYGTLGSLSGVTGSVVNGPRIANGALSVNSATGLGPGTLISIPGSGGGPYSLSDNANWAGPLQPNFFPPAPIAVGGASISYAGDSITVTAPGATVGPVTYPDNQSWTCTLTSVPSALTITATASDGEVASLVWGSVSIAPSAGSMLMAAGTPTIAIGSGTFINPSAASMLLAAGVPLVVPSKVLTAQAAAMLMVAAQPTVLVAGLSPFKAPDGTPLPLKAWNGSSWVAVPMRLWNGSMFN